MLKAPPGLAQDLMENALPCQLWQSREAGSCSRHYRTFNGGYTHLESISPHISLAAGWLGKARPGEGVAMGHSFGNLV